MHCHQDRIVQFSAFSWAFENNFRCCVREGYGCFSGEGAEEGGLKHRISAKTIEIRSSQAFRKEKKNIV